MSTLQKEQKDLKSFSVEQKTNAGNSVKARISMDHLGKKSPWPSSSMIFRIKMSTIIMIIMASKHMIMDMLKKKNTFYWHIRKLFFCPTKDHGDHIVRQLSLPGTL